MDVRFVIAAPDEHPWTAQWREMMGVLEHMEGLCSVGIVMKANDEPQEWDVIADATAVDSQTSLRAIQTILDIARKFDTIIHTWPRTEQTAESGDEPKKWTAHVQFTMAARAGGWRDAPKAEGAP